MIVQFRSAAAGFPLPINWQWQVMSDGSGWVDLSDGSGFSGVNTPTLSVDVEDDSMDGWQFRAVADNGPLTRTSEPATLNVTGA